MCAKCCKSRPTHHTDTARNPRASLPGGARCQSRSGCRAKQRMVSRHVSACALQCMNPDYLALISCPCKRPFCTLDAICQRILGFSLGGGITAESLGIHPPQYARRTESRCLAALYWGCRCA